ncbi:MAG: PspC domain-containing protein [Alistipes sp.]
MKETVNVNVGSQAFTIDQDAYGALRSYLDDIRRRLPVNDTETMSDIEVRIAEIFRDKIGISSMRVVTLETIHQAMMQMGAPADFGVCSNQQTEPQEPALPPASHKLYRSRADYSIAGICGGLAVFFGCDSTPLRLVTLLLILFGGLSIWVYVILWIVVPKEPEVVFPTSKNNKKQ